MFNRAIRIDGAVKGAAANSSFSPQKGGPQLDALEKMRQDEVQLYKQPLNGASKVNTTAPATLLKKTEISVDSAQAAAAARQYN